MTRGWRKLQSGELSNLCTCCTPNILVADSLFGHAACNEDGQICLIFSLSKGNMLMDIIPLLEVLKDGIFL